MISNLCFGWAAPPSSFESFKQKNQKLWIWFGAMVAGIGLLNKYSISIFGLGIVVGLVLTSERKALTHKWIWIGGLIALLIFLPNSYLGREMCITTGPSCN